MQENNVLSLTMESEAFNGLKNDFDKVLRRTLTNMERQNSEQAELTVKLKILLKRDVVPDLDETKYSAERDIVKPTFTHKVSSVMQTKCEEGGVLGGDYELIWDEASGDYVLRPINDNQLSIFDENAEAREPLCLETGEETSVQEIVDADYREIEDNNASDDYDYEEPDEETVQ